MFYEAFRKHIEALLFASGNPLSANKIARIIEVPEEHVELFIEKIIIEINKDYRGLTIVQVADGYQLCTKPELSDVVKALAQVQDSKLSLAAMETLSIVAFKQPITK